LVCQVAVGPRQQLQVYYPQRPTLNLVSGQGHSVLDVVKAFEQANGRTIHYPIVARRHGDAAITVADPTLAGQTLGWGTQRGLK
jgi:UDP-glucose 4-epimerase